MTQIHDEQALLPLLKVRKKKYVKQLLQYSVGLNLCHNNPPRSFKTPLISTFSSDLKLSVEQSHRLMVALSQLVDISARIGFDFEHNNIFSGQFDEQLKELLINTLVNMQNEIQELRVESMKVGNKLIDFNWMLDLQVASLSGKNNIPYVTIEMESLNNAQLQVDKMQLNGEQFLAFFGNLKKIKETLLKLTQKSQQ